MSVTTKEHEANLAKARELLEEARGKKFSIQRQAFAEAIALRMSYQKATQILDEELE